MVLTEVSFSGGGAASGSHSGGTYIERITNDAREDEMEENMQAVCSCIFNMDSSISILDPYYMIYYPLLPQVGSVLSNLKEMSQAMGGEIERQNKQLDKIGGKTDVADVNIDRANMRTQKLLK